MKISYQSLLELNQNIVFSNEQFNNIISKLFKDYTVSQYESDNKKVIFATIIKNDDHSFSHLWYINLDAEDSDIGQAYNRFLNNA